MRKAAYLLIAMTAIVLAACKSPKHLAGTPRKSTEKTLPDTKVQTPPYLSSRVQLTLPNSKGGSMSVSGTMKMKADERIQVSLLMPILRTEVARAEITPQEVLLIDRMGKRYVRATAAELKDVLPRKADYQRLQTLLTEASLPGGKAEFTGLDAGIPSLEKLQVRLYDFSLEEFTLTPAEVTAKYRQVALDELVNLLLGLLK